MSNFGSICLEDGMWVIACEAHVRTKIKRLFPEVNQRAGDTIRISDNEENCRDLIWLMQRYPMEIQQLDRMQARADRHIEQANLVAALLGHRQPPEDFELAKPPRQYQTIAASLCEIKRGLLVADDVGLGKTVTSICLMARQQNLPVLVVTLTHLPTQWASEIKDFAPELKVHILKSGKPYDLIPKKSRSKQVSLFESEEPRLPDVIISNYHKLNGWSDTLAGLVKYVVFDEIQELRREESNKYAAAKFIADKSELRIGLSATPIYNYGAEFFNVIDVLRPGSLGTRPEFLREWCSGDTRISEPRAFGDYLRREGIMIRRTRSDVGRELPPVTKIPQYVDSDKAVLDKIKGSAVELAKTILAVQQNYKGEKFLAAEEFNILMRQATGISKAGYVAEFVRLLLESGEQVILYGWHRDVYAIWLEALADWSPRLYTGTESPKEKAEAKDEFVSGNCKLLIISLRAGAGLDGLQHCCSTVVFGELDYSPGVHEQCIGRVDRDGQEDPVMAYYLISESGSDPIIADILGVKRGQIEGVCDPDANLIEKLEVEGGNAKRLAEAYLKQVGISTETHATELEAA